MEKNHRVRGKHLQLSSPVRTASKYSSFYMQQLRNIVPQSQSFMAESYTKGK